MTVRIDRPKPVTVLSPVTRETTTLSESYTKYINTNLETNFNVHQKHAHKRSNEMVDRLTLPIESFYIYWETHHNKQNSNLLSWGQQFKKKRFDTFLLLFNERKFLCVSQLLQCNGNICRRCRDSMNENSRVCSECWVWGPLGTLGIRSVWGLALVVGLFFVGKSPNNNKKERKKIL